jgi:hypothetical protein
MQSLEFEPGRRIFMLQSGESALHWAAKEHRLENVKILLQAGLSAELRNKDGATPLDFLVQNEREQIDGPFLLAHSQRRSHRIEKAATASGTRISCAFNKRYHFCKRTRAACEKIDNKAFTMTKHR